MKINKAGRDLILEFEGGHKLNAYICPAGIPTISAGLTRIYNRPVRMGDKLTLEESNRLFDIELSRFETGVLNLVKTRINNNQFSALVSFSFNVGLGNLRTSTLLRKVNMNPNDPTIRQEFLRWNRGGGIVLNGLTRRREAEADLYFTI